MRDLTTSEIDSVSGGIVPEDSGYPGWEDDGGDLSIGSWVRRKMKTTKEIWALVPPEAQLATAIGAGAMTGALAGPAGAVAGGVVGGIGYMFF